MHNKKKKQEAIRDLGVTEYQNIRSVELLSCYL